MDGCGRLVGKVALISGASSGVGRATLQLFAREGAAVVGVARRGSELRDALDNALASGVTGSVIEADVATEEGALQAVHHVIETYARLDILVNAAGIGHAYGLAHPGSMEDVANTDLYQWRTVLDADLTSVFLMSREAIPHMQERGIGSIVNIASISGLVGLPVAHAYTAAKAGVVNLTKSMAVAYARQGIRSNCVAPGYVDTPMIKGLMSVFDDPGTAFEASPMGRAATPLEIAHACLFLASDESSYCNGSVLTVDGGTTSHQRSGPVLH